MLLRRAPYCYDHTTYHALELRKPSHVLFTNGAEAAPREPVLDAHPMEHMPTRQCIRLLLLQLHQANGTLFHAVLLSALTSVCCRCRPLLRKLLPPLFVCLLQEHLEHGPQASDMLLTLLDFVVALRKVGLHSCKCVAKLVALRGETISLAIVALDLLLQCLYAALEAATLC